MISDFFCSAAATLHKDDNEEWGHKNHWYNIFICTADYVKKAKDKTSNIKLH